MKKLLVALAVVASIGVTLSENNVVNVKANYAYLLDQGLSEGTAQTLSEWYGNKYTWLTCDEVRAL